MKAYSLNDLFCLSRAALFALHAEITALLASLPKGTPEEMTARQNLCLIRRVLSRPMLSP